MELHSPYEIQPGDECKNVTVSQWKLFMGNHWQHMTWKVNMTIALNGIIISIVLALLALLLAHIDN